MENNKPPRTNKFINIVSFELKLKKNLQLQNWWLIGIGFIAGLYYFIEIVKDCIKFCGH